MPTNQLTPDPQEADDTLQKPSESSKPRRSPRAAAAPADTPVQSDVLATALDAPAPEQIKVKHPKAARKPVEIPPSQEDVKAAKQAEKAAKKAAKQAEKAAKKAAKVAKKAAKQAEKAAKKAAKQAEKQAKKAAKQAEKQTKKAAKQAEKQAK